MRPGYICVIIKSMNKKKRNLVLIVIIVLAIAGLFVKKYLSAPGVQAYEFTGSISKVDDDVIYMHGNYNVTDHPELRGDDMAIDAMVRIKSGTKFIRITIYRPDNLAEQLASGKAVDPSSFKREVKAGSVEDLMGGNVRDAIIETNKNIYGKESFAAQSITYYYPVDEGSK